MTRETLPSGIIRTTWHRLPQVRLEVDTLAVWDIWEESEGYVFGDIKAASGGPEGFYLVDAGTRQIVLVDRQGEVRQTFGGQGSGPGEFQYPLQIFTRDDEVWVADFVSQRYSVFNQEGEFVRVRAWNSPGRLIIEGFAITPAGGELCIAQSVDGSRTLLHSPPGGAAADTIAVMRTHPASGVEINIPGLGPVTMYDPPAYSPELHWTWEEDGRVLTVTSTEYRIEQRDTEGRILQELVTPTPDLTVTAADREAFMIRMARLYDCGIEEFRRSNPRFESEYPFAEKRTAIAGITVDPLGRTWVLANIPVDTGQRLDLFDPDFAYLGSLMDLPLPETFMPGGEALFRIPDFDTGADLFFVARIGG